MVEPRALTGSTRIAGVIGHPVRHSRSPALVNAAFAAAGLDWAFAAFDVAPGQGAAAVVAARTLGLGGLSVTMPHKADVIGPLDACTADAEALRSVNCIAWDGDRLVGHSTDGPGLVASLRIDHALDPAGRRCAVLGAGGAARSVVRALAGAGATEVVVVNRTASSAVEAAALAGAVGRTGSMADLAGAELIVNATSVGMGAADTEGPRPLEPALLRSGQIVVDLVYQPLETPLLAAARSAGCRAIDGLGMLVHQAALAVELWTGVAPDIGAMAAAARA